MMNRFLLSIGEEAMSKTERIAATPILSTERFLEAGQMIVLGMITIFSVLALLWGILELFRVFFAGKKRENDKDEKAPESAAVPVATSEVPAAPSDDGALIAVLVAAVAAYRASEGEDAENTEGFRVVSYRRVAQGATWNRK